MTRNKDTHDPVVVAVTLGLGRVDSRLDSFASTSLALQARLPVPGFVSLVTFFAAVQLLALRLRLLPLRRHGGLCDVDGHWVARSFGVRIPERTPRYCPRRERRCRRSSHGRALHPPQSTASARSGRAPSGCSRASLSVLSLSARTRSACTQSVRSRASRSRASSH